MCRTPIKFSPSLSPQLGAQEDLTRQANIDDPSLPGVDPSTQDALSDGNEDTRKRIEKLGDDTRKGRDALDEFEENEKDSAKKMGEEDPLSKLLSGFSSSMPTGQMPSMPSIPQIPLDQLAGTTQDQLSGAGNKEQLINALLNATQNPDGSLSYNGTQIGNPSSSIGVDGDGYEGQIQDLANQLVAANIPYAWGGGTLDDTGYGLKGDNAVADRMGDYNKKGFDCSGLTRYMIYQVYGVEIPRVSQEQYSAGIPVSASEARPGDLFFPTDAGRPPGHVQLYVGGDQVIEAPSSGQFVKFSGLEPGEFRRMVDA